MNGPSTPNAEPDPGVVAAGEARRREGPAGPATGGIPSPSLSGNQVLFLAALFLTCFVAGELLTRVW